MTDRLENVALAGASGMLGHRILNALIDSGRFNITILTRNGDEKEFPTTVNVAQVDYDSFDSILQALSGIDVLISSIAKTALPVQLRLIDAAVSAGVHRFIPSEFGGDLKNPKTRQFPTYADKITVQNHLEHAAATSNLTYTYIFNNVLLDWGLRTGFLLNFKTREANLYDGGETNFSTTRTTTVAQGVVGVLAHLEETKNRGVYIQDTVTTQKKLVELAQKHTSGKTWMLKNISSATLEEEARSDIAKGKLGLKVFYAFAVRAGFSQGYGGHFQKTDNALLGLKEITEDELDALILSTYIDSKVNV